MGDQHQPRHVPGRGVERIAVLTSGGLDSCVLLADLARENTVYPIYVEFGLAWERAEPTLEDVFIDLMSRSKDNFP